MTWGTRLRAAIAAIVVGGAFAPPATSASAATVQVNGAPLLNATLTVDPSGLLTGDKPLLAPVTQVFCSATQGGDPTLHGAMCALNSLEYQFYTRLKTPAGDVVRKTAAVVNVPTPIDIDGDLVPDFIGTLQVLALDKFTLKIDRMLTEVEPDPVSIEAIINDPTGGAIPRQKINAGYDARASRAPVGWSTTVTLPKESDPTLTTVEASTSVMGAGTTLATLAGLFDGDAGARSNPMGGRLAYTPVPPTATVGMTLGGYLEARVGASLPVGLHGDVEIVESPREQRAAVDVGGLPQQIAVRHTQTATDKRTVTYGATSVVPSLDAVYTDTTASTLSTKAVVHARMLPTGMTLEQLSAKKATFAANAPLGSVEVGYANGEPKLLNVDQPYARVFDDGTLKSYAGRVDDLLSASFDATTRIVGELQLGPALRKPFRVLVDQPGGLHIDGNVSDLPRHLKIVYDKDQGLIDYDAFGETIQQIDVDASQDAVFFGRVKRLVGVIKQLPSQATVNIKPNDGGIKLETNNPIGEAQALLTSGPTSLLLPAGVYGATVEDKASHFAAFARVKGLKLADVTTGPGDKLTGHVQLASTPLELHHRTDTRAIDANLSPIPTDMTLSFDPTAGTLAYDANAGIDQITANVDQTTALFGEVKHLDATIKRMPAHVDVGFKPASGSGGAFTANPAVGMIEANLTDGAASAPALPAGQSGVNLRDLPGGFALRGRLFEVKGATVTTAGSNVTATLDTNPLEGGTLQDLNLDLMFNDPNDAVGPDAKIVGFVKSLPTHLSLVQTGGQTTYDANGTVPLVTLSADNLPGGASGGSMDGGLHFVRGTLTGVPKHFDIVHSGATNGVVGTGPFTRADLEAWDHGPQNAAFPEDDRNKVALNTRDGRLHVQARVFDLKTVKLTDLGGQKIETEFGAAPPPMDVSFAGGTTAHAVETDPGPLDVGVEITNMPIASTFEIATLLGMKVKWDGASPDAGATQVKLNLSARDVGIKDLVVTLPQSAEVCVGGKLDCSPVSPSVWQAGDDTWVTPNSFAVVSTASGLITVGGKVCLPPTDDEGDPVPFPQNTVYGACADGSSPNWLTIANMRFEDMRLEFMSGDTQNKDEDGDPIEDGLLKLYFKSDDNGLRTDGLHVRNDTSDSTTDLVAGDNGRPALTHTGGHFLGLYDLDFPPSTEFVTNRLNCDGLDIEVGLPIIGQTDVIPGLAEVFIDICS